MRIIAENQNGYKLYEDENGEKYAECKTCKEEGRGFIKPTTDFVKSMQMKLGVLSDCNECRKEQKKIYRKENPEVSREYNRRPERVIKQREHRKKWSEKNPEKVKQYRKTRLNREEAALYAIPIKEKNKALKQYAYSCALTGAKFNYHVDHVIALETGHASSNFENLLPLRNDLNLSKNERNIFEWAEQEHKHLGFTLDRFNEVMIEVASRSDMTLEEYEEYVNFCFNNPLDISG
ncbi:MAG: hypothetical protein IE909_14770 [Campylobacterales bacterium]|nr:hypothetical protein [Campylobacterales bacterium]